MNAGAPRSTRTKPGGPSLADSGRRIITGAQIRADEAMPITRSRDRFERKPEDLIAMLLTIQRGLGYLPENALLEVARLTKVPPATVYGVATFYEQFRLNPSGRHRVKVCRGTACHVRGADRILNEVQTAYNVEPGETTDDGSFTLETVACFGSCALAPVVVVDATVKGRMTPSKTHDALARLGETTESSITDGRSAKV